MYLRETDFPCSTFTDLPQWLGTRSSNRSLIVTFRRKSQPLIKNPKGSEQKRLAGQRALKRNSLLDVGWYKDEQVNEGRTSEWKTNNTFVPLKDAFLSFCQFEGKDKRRQRGKERLSSRSHKVVAFSAA